jgi:uncharacterized membrane protein
VRRERHRHRIKSSILFGFFVTVLILVIFGAIEAAARGRFLVPIREIPRRLPTAVSFGAIAGAASYCFDRIRPTVVCTKCGTVQYAGESTRCPCGGQFENIEEMKWK